MAFLDAVVEANLSQMVLEPTHIAGNILDLVLTNTPSEVTNVEVDFINRVSDHSLLKVDFLAKSQTPPSI